MREGVTYKRLGDLASFVNGYAFKPETWSDSGIPIIRIQNLNNPDAAFNYYDGEIPSKYVVEEGDLLISWSASLGAYFWNREKAYLNQHIFKVVFDKGDINKSYLKYAVEAQLEDMKRKAHGGTMQHIVKKDFDATPIPVPSLSTQELIVRELDSISSVISAKKQQVLELDNLAQAIFLDMFGDPITNPKGWEVKKMSEVAEIGSGGTPSKQNLLYWENGDVPWIGSNMCQNCVIYQTDGKYITRDGLNNSSAKLLSKGTVLVALVGATIGKVALLETETSTNQNVAFIKPKDVCLPYYLYFHLMHLYDLFMNIGNGDFKMANLSFVRNLPVSLPPLSLQQAFAEKVQVIEEQKRLINQSIAEFESLLAQRMEFHFA